MGLDSKSVPDDKGKILSSDDDMDEKDLCQFIVDNHFTPNNTQGV